MLHPSYSDLMKVVNSEVEPGEAPVVNSRYSIVMATSKRARQLISGEDALIFGAGGAGAGKKPLSLAVEELNQGKIRILTEEEARLGISQAGRGPAGEKTAADAQGKLEREALEDR